MRGYTTAQQAVIDSEAPEGYFLFEVYFDDSSGSAASYHWAMDDITYDSTDYTGKILSHSGMNFNLGTIELKQINPSTMNIQIAFSGSSIDGLYASDFEGAYVKVRAIGKVLGGDYQELACTKYKIVTSISIDQVMEWELQDPFTLALEGTAPLTPLISDVFPSTASRHDTIPICGPVYGVAWVMLRLAVKNYEATKVDGDSFTVSGDHTDTFVAGLHLIADGSTNLWVASSSYADGLTTVNTDAADVPDGLYSILINFYPLGTDDGQTYTIYSARSPKEQNRISNYSSSDYTFLQFKVQGSDDNWYQCVILKAIDADGDGTYDSNIYWGPSAKEAWDVPVRISQDDLVSTTDPINVIRDLLVKFGYDMPAIDTADELLTDGNMETDPESNWPGLSPLLLTVEEETTIVHGGSKSLKITSHGGGFASQIITTVAGKEYGVIGWVRNDSGNSGSTKSKIVATQTYVSTILGSAISTGSGSYERVEFTFTASSTATTIRLYPQNGVDDISYFDDISVIPYQAYLVNVFAYRQIEFHFGLWYMADRNELIASLFAAANMYPRIRDELDFKLFTAAYAYTLNEASVEPGSVAVSKAQNRRDQMNSGYVLWLSDMQSADQPFKSLVAAKSLTSKPSALTVDCTFIRTPDSSSIDSQTALRSGKWVIQRALLTDKNFRCTCLAHAMGLEMGDIMRINSANLGKESGNFDVLVKSISISPLFKISLDAISFRDTLDEWADLTATAREAVDTVNLTKGVSPVMQSLDSGENENWVTEKIKVAPGGDIELTSSDTDPAVIKFGGTTYSVEVGGDADGNRFMIKADTANVIDFFIGSEAWWGGSGIFKSISLWAKDSIILNCGDLDNTNNAGIVYCYENQVEIFAQNGDGNWQSFTYDYNKFGIWRDNYTDIGDDTYSFKDIYAYDYPVVADFYFLDNKKDLDLIGKIKGSGRIDPITDLELIDDDSLPVLILKRCIQSGNILKNKDGKPFISLKAAISLIFGAIRELDKKKADK